jgi:leader peptidase (prepilin peptidase)/N-methyltransferase
MIRLLTLAFAALGGLIAGSFFNVCIHRLPRRESVVSPGSRCPNCGAAIGWRDNIPILSWIALRGRCRQCSARISAQYPLIELVTAVVAVAVVAVTPVGPLLASRLVLAGILIVLFMIDLEHQILPNVITLPGIVVGFLFSLVAPPGPISSLAGIVLGGGVLYLIGTAYYVVRKEEGMGMGDVKMLAMIGAFLGWQAVVLTVVLSSFAGAVIGLALIVFTRADMRHALPFGTFLALGAMVAMVAGDAIVSWYTGLYPTL